MDRKSRHCTNLVEGKALTKRMRLLVQLKPVVRLKFMKTIPLLRMIACYVVDTYDKAKIHEDNALIKRAS